MSLVVPHFHNDGVEGKSKVMQNAFHPMRKLDGVAQIDVLKFLLTWSQWVWNDYNFQNNYN